MKHPVGYAAHHNPEYTRPAMGRHGDEGPRFSFSFSDDSDGGITFWSSDVYGHTKSTQGVLHMSQIILGITTVMIEEPIHVNGVGRISGRRVYQVERLEEDDWNLASLCQDPNVGKHLLRQFGSI